MNNLKQMGLAAQQHLEKNRRYPTGGWGPRWVGLADGGTGVNQPGGWVFNILPYVEQEALHDATANLKGAAQHAEQDKQVQITLAFMNCPSRRGTQRYPLGGAGSESAMGNAYFHIAPISRGPMHCKSPRAAPCRKEITPRTLESVTMAPTIAQDNNSDAISIQLQRDRPPAASILVLRSGQKRCRV